MHAEYNLHAQFYSAMLDDARRTFNAVNRIYFCLLEKLYTSVLYNPSQESQQSPLSPTVAAVMPTPSVALLRQGEHAVDFDCLQKWVKYDSITLLSKKDWGA